MGNILQKCGRNMQYCNECKMDVSKTTDSQYRKHQPCDLCNRQTCFKSEANWNVKNWHCKKCSYKWAKVKAKIDPTYIYR